MPEFVISLTGPKGEEHGTLLVDGRQPELFGELVGCNVTRVLPEISQGVHDLARMSSIAIRPPRATVVEVTLRLPLGPTDQVTILREGEIRNVHGPTGDWVATAPAAAELARILTERVEAARDAIALRDSNGFPPEWLGDALLAVLKIHGGDLATLRAVAEEIGIEVDRG